MDLRPINEVIQSMDQLHPEIPLLSLLLKGYSIIVIVFKRLIFPLYFYKNKIKESMLSQCLNKDR